MSTGICDLTFIVQFCEKGFCRKQLNKYTKYRPESDILRHVVQNKNAPNRKFELPSLWQVWRRLKIIQDSHCALDQPRRGVSGVLVVSLWRDQILSRLLQAVPNGGGPRYFQSSRLTTSSFKNHSRLNKYSQRVVPSTRAAQSSFLNYDPRAISYDPSVVNYAPRVVCFAPRENLERKHLSR